MKKIIIAAATASLLLAGCADLQGIGPKQGVGTLGGAAAGGLAGAQIGKGSGKLAATAFGTLLGAFLGSEIGSSLDKADQLALEHSTTIALNTERRRQPIGWRNKRTGNHGTVTVTRERSDLDGDYCREFQQTVTVGGRTQDAYGTACQQPDGTWEITS